MNIGEENKPMERERIKLWEKMVFKEWQKNKVWKI